MNILNWRLFLEELVGEKPISDLQSYIDGMNYSMKDKMFFTDIIDFDLIVDFGCADGTFLEQISRIKPGVKLMVYHHQLPQYFHHKKRILMNSVLDILLLGYLCIYTPLVYNHNIYLFYKKVNPIK